MGHCAVTMPDSLRIRIHGEDSGIAAAVAAADD
jgi:hypothetical protein